MKKLTLLLATVIYCLGATAQEDTVVVGKRSDTMRIGNILIIKKGGKKRESSDTTRIELGRDTERRKNSRIQTNWWIIDFGFANYTDKTNYAAATADGYLINSTAPGVPALSAPDFKLRTGKSINVNIWFFMQRLNIIKSNVSLKYGLGLELNNYRYKSNISYRENGVKPYDPGMNVTNAPFIFRDSVSFSKNKLAADYLTVPFMLSFSTNRSDDKKGLIASFGVSAGYLYSQRNKQKNDARGKDKNKGEYDLEKFKLSYIAELGLGPVRLYGSYSPKSMYEHSMDIRPYTVGFRFSKL